MFVILAAAPLHAQDHAHPPDSTRADSSRQNAQPMPMDMPGMAAPGGQGMPAMSGTLGIPMDRMGSGTTWIPDAASLPSRHIAARGWDVMMHGFLYAQYDAQGGPRGDRQFGSLNWAMLMATRTVAGGSFQARTMLSLDPLTVGGRGYPLLLQSGDD